MLLPPVILSPLSVRSLLLAVVVACYNVDDDDDDDGGRCIKNRNEGGKRRRGRTASRSRGGKEPPVKLSFAAIIAFRLVSSGSLRIPLSNVLELPSSFFPSFFRPAASFPYPPPPSTSFFCYGSWSISSRRAPSFPLSLASRGKIRTVVNIAFEHSSPHFSALYRLTLVPSINCNI